MCLQLHRATKIRLDTVPLYYFFLHKTHPTTEPEEQIEPF